MQGHFSKLSNVCLRGLYLSDDDVALLRVLPHLTILNLSSTGISNNALHHLVCHHKSLTGLNISENQQITDDARFTLGALDNLTVIYLRGTNMSMGGLRQLALNVLPKKCRIFSIPVAAINLLQKMQGKYCDFIPPGYIDDASKVEHLTLAALKKNLELHAKYGEVSLTGNKVDLVHRLKALLTNRRGDMRLVEILGPPKDE